MVSLWSRVSVSAGSGLMMHEATMRMMGPSFSRLRKQECRRENGHRRFIRHFICQENGRRGQRKRRLCDLMISMLARRPVSVQLPADRHP
jgi:hypothetical protein